jgi:hypothetical protein
VKPETAFDRLAQRDTELHALAVRGRRRSLRILILAMLPSPFLVMWMNHDSGATGLVPIFVAGFAGISYSWTKWQKRPEDTQSIAFMGLDRRTRWSTYRALWRGSPIADPVVLTMLETIHGHVRESFWIVTAAMVAAAATGVVLVSAAGDGHAGQWSVAIVAILAVAIAVHRLLTTRAALVIARSRRAT